LLLASIFLMPLAGQAYAEEFLFKNDQITIYKWKLSPGERVGQHIDTNPQIVIALQGSTLTRIAADGSTTQVVLPTGSAVYQDPDLELHDAINASDVEVEAIMIELNQEGWLQK
jgi:hypothetical protein